MKLPEGAIPNKNKRYGEVFWTTINHCNRLLIYPGPIMPGCLQTRIPPKPIDFLLKMVNTFQYPSFVDISYAATAFHTPIRSVQFVFLTTCHMSNLKKTAAFALVWVVLPRMWEFYPTKRDPTNQPRSHRRYLTMVT